LKEERHVDERVSHADRLDEGPYTHACLIRGKRQWLVDGSKILFSRDLVPDRCVDSVGIARRRRLEIDDQQVELVAQELGGLADEVVESPSTRFIALRHNLDDRNQTVTQDVSNRHDVLLAPVKPQVSLSRNANTRFNHEHATTRGLIPFAIVRATRHGWFRRVVIWLGRFACLERQDIGLKRCPFLLGEGIVLPRKQTFVE
jgi:hypothetical protein